MDAKVRVAFTLEQCWHEVPGGTAVAAIELGRALEENPAVELIGVAARHRNPAPAAWAPPVPVRHLRLPRPLVYEMWHRLRRLDVQKATGPVDVIHATTIAIPPRSAPLIVTIHDLLWLRDPSLFTRRGVRFFDRGLAIARAEADLVVCASDATMADCLAAGFERERLRKIPLGVRAEPVTESAIAEARSRYGLARPYVLWTGTIEPRKNLGGLLQALALVERDIDLVLAGPRGWNEDIAGALGGAKERVKAIGFVPRSDLGPLYAGATVFCWPSLLEGFGFPVLEAMAYGTPVVTSRGTSTEELGADAAVLVDPRDPSAIAAGITSLLDDDSLRASLMAAGRTRAAEYTWARTAELTARAYAELKA